MAYVSIVTFGVVTTSLSLAYRIRNARLMRVHVLELTQRAAAPTHKMSLNPRAPAPLHPSPSRASLERHSPGRSPDRRSTIANRPLRRPTLAEARKTLHGALALSPELLQQDKTVVIIAARRQSQQNEWELAQTHRTKVILSLELLSLAAQGALPQSELVPDARDEAAFIRRRWLCRSADVDPQLLYRLFHRSCGQDGEHIPRCQEAQELVFPQTRSTRCHTE